MIATCATGAATGARKEADLREGDAGASPRTMNAQRMKEDMARRQREDDQLRLRDDFIQRNQRP
jgi:hypothetical protein